MKKNCLLWLVMFCAVAVYAGSDTSMLYFATGKGGEIVESVHFQNGGRLTFGDEVMNYTDADVNVDIPYTGGEYIYFGERAETSVEHVPVVQLQLDYVAESGQVVLLGAEQASCIRLYSAQGVLLREVLNANSLSISGLHDCIVVAYAVCDGQCVINKFIIK